MNCLGGVRLYYYHYRRGEGYKKNNTVEDKMFTQLRPYRNLTVWSGRKTQVMI